MLHNGSILLGCILSFKGVQRWWKKETDRQPQRLQFSIQWTATALAAATTTSPARSRQPFSSRIEMDNLSGLEGCSKRRASPFIPAHTNPFAFDSVSLPSYVPFSKATEMKYSNWCVISLLHTRRKPKSSVITAAPVSSAADKDPLPVFPLWTCISS